MYSYTRSRLWCSLAVMMLLVAGSCFGSIECRSDWAGACAIERITMRVYEFQCEWFVVIIIVSIEVRARARACVCVFVWRQTHPIRFDPAWLDRLIYFYIACSFLTRQLILRKFNPISSLISSHSLASSFFFGLSFYRLFSKYSI